MPTVILETPKSRGVFWKALISHVKLLDSDHMFTQIVMVRTANEIGRPAEKMKIKAIPRRIFSLRYWTGILNYYLHDLYKELSKLNDSPQLIFFSICTFGLKRASCRNTRDQILQEIKPTE